MQRLSDYTRLLPVKATRFHIFLPTTFRAADCGTILEVKVQICPMPVNKLPLVAGGLTATHKNVSPSKTLYSNPWVRAIRNLRQMHGTSSSLALDELRHSHSRLHSQLALTRQSPFFL